MPQDPYRKDASITPTGMSRSHGQSRQASRAALERRPNAQVKDSILNPQSFTMAPNVLMGAQRSPNSQIGASPKDFSSANLGGATQTNRINRQAMEQVHEPKAQRPYSAEGGGIGGARAAILQGAQGVGPATAPAAPAAPGRTGFGGMNLDFAGLQNPMNFSGFNLDRAFAGGDPDSVKDGFARTVGGLGVDVRGLDKAQVGEVLASQVVPALNQNGIQARIQPGSYDIIEVFSAERGWEPIDVVQNAGSADAAWAWQDNPGMGLGPMPANSLYAQTQQSILNPQAPVAPEDEEALWLLLQQLMQQDQGVPQFPEQDALF